MSYSRVIRLPDHSRSKGDAPANNEGLSFKEDASCSSKIRKRASNGYSHQNEESFPISLTRSRCERTVEARTERRGLTAHLLHLGINSRKSSRKRLNYRPSFGLKYRGPICFKLIVLILLMALPGIGPSELSKLICSFLEYKDDCLRQLDEDRAKLDPNVTYCPGEFDNYMCWTHGVPGKSATAPCPSFFVEANGTVGYRFCQANGSWHTTFDEAIGGHVIWRHIEECDPTIEPANDNVTVPIDNGNDSETKLLTNLQIMYTIGYGVSLVCLVIALLLLGFFKKLHCTRNYIHMNLMVSFIIRYVVILIKDSVLISHYKLEALGDVSNHLDYDRLQQYCETYGEPGWVLTRCRLMLTLMHYAITANYFWLLAEGLYLQMLLVFVMSENKYFAGFMIFGWGAPWISVLIWVALRLNYENTGCWDMNIKLHVWWTIRVPIIISIVINFLIFLNIVRLIVSKLQAHNMAHSDYKLRLAKSTLALIPLLGIHYIVFLALTEEVSVNTTPMHLKLAFEMFLTSFQGTLVSVLYCFLNGEVRAEVKKAWRDWRTRKDLPKGASNFRKGSTIHSGNQSTSVTYFSRHSTAGADYLLMHEVKNNNTRLDNGNILQYNGETTFKTEKSNGNGHLVNAQNSKVDSEHSYVHVDTDSDSLKSNSLETTASNSKQPNGNVNSEEEFLREQND